MSPPPTFGLHQSHASAVVWVVISTASALNARMVRLAVTLWRSALLLVIKWKCFSIGLCLGSRVQSAHYCASTTQVSVNLIIYTLDVSIIGGIVKLQSRALGVKM